MISKDKLENPEQYRATVERLCEWYQRAFTLHEDGIRLICVDEKTGIQAIERHHPNLPPQPGHSERLEAHYSRHGTCCLIANFEVATGQVIAPTLGPTRTEADFVQHIRQTLQTDPDAKWVFIPSVIA